MVKVIFDKIRETTRVELLGGSGAFRMPGEVCTLSRADADALFMRGLASPWPNTSMDKPIQDTAIHASDVVKKEDGGASEVSEASPPLFVVIPTKGGRAHDLKRTLAAVFLDPPPGLTVCVVFDGKQVDRATRDAVRWWSNRLEGLGLGAALMTACRIVKPNPNMARDIGVLQAPPDTVIVEVDDHDAPEPGALRAIAKAFENPTIQAVYGNHHVVAPDGCLIRTEKLEDYYDGLFCEMCPSRGTRAYRKAVYIDVGGYRANEFPSGDHFLWLRFAELLRDLPGAIFHLALPLARFKVAVGSISLRHAEAQAQMSERAVLASMTGTLMPPASALEVSEPELPDFSAVRVLGTADPTPYRGAVIVVPCFRSRSTVFKLLESMTPAEQSATVLVIDGEEDYAPTERAARITLSENTGFAHACNAGAKLATQVGAEFVCFLNADTLVRPGWFDGLIDEAAHLKNVGIVGGRQTDKRGAIHSCGSEWNYETHNFEHVLRGQEPAGQPEWTARRDLDMITASCILMPRAVFNEVEGFDERYRLGYWEDSDLCMRVRSAGYRIRFTPNSTIVHFQGGSGLGSRHRFYQQNAQLCRRRWIKSGQVDKFAIRRGRRVHDGDIVACYIVLNEEEFIQASIESVYPLADRIIIVEGGNDYAVSAGLCGPDKRSADATVERIQALADPERKIELIRGAWSDKVEQRQAYAKRLRPGDWMLLMDGDEVFYDASLWRLSYLMHSADILRPMFDLFWNDFQTLGTGIWDKFPQAKVIRWKDGYHYRDHNCPCDASGRLVVMGQGQGVIHERMYAHYAWVKPIEKLRRKAAYYERQPGARERMRPNYIDRVFLPWREHPLKITQEFGSHPFGSGGAALFEGEHPEPIRTRLEAGEFSWKE